mmetsp:Transcript_11642/g.34228  ORF Transcript_11642/g.34228 Transcript_11642/m.34228 type:complete len:80 (-) Transcript_11642:1721-1960(-)
MELVLSPRYSISVKRLSSVGNDPAMPFSAREEGPRKMFQLSHLLERKVKARNGQVDSELLTHVEVVMPQLTLGGKEEGG